MRIEFHADLDRLTAEVGEMCAIAGDVIQCATAALVETDARRAEKVLVDLERLDRLRDRVIDRVRAAGVASAGGPGLARGGFLDTDRGRG